MSVRTVRDAVLVSLRHLFLIIIFWTRLKTVLKVCLLLYYNIYLFIEILMYSQLLQTILSDLKLRRFHF